MTPNQDQTRFAEHLGTPMRANAGAGTGKTTGIVERVRTLIESAVPARAILLMTFSRKAAGEMKTRLRRKIGVASEDVNSGTFHSIAAQELRRLAKPGERPVILDENDAEDFWTQAFEEVLCPTPEAFKANLANFRQEMGKKELKKPDPDKQWASILKDLASGLRKLRSEQLNMNRAAEDFGQLAIGKLREAKPAAGKVEKFMDLTGWINQGLANYERIKLEHRCLDYDDALNRWANLLKNDAEYRERVQNRWQHVLVDEYQDTNFLQEEIIRNLNIENLTVVGDPAQCVYAFRSAVPRLMIEFHQRYQNVEEVALKDNYRSKDEIIKVANHVLTKHDDMLRENHPDNPMARLQLKGTRGPGARVKFLRTADTKEEIGFVFDEIRRLLAAGESKKDIIVLTRNSYYTQPLETLLRTAKVPVQIWGGTSLMESQTMKDLIALMKIALRPSQPQNFKRVAKYVVGGERKHEFMFLRWKMGLSPLEGTTEFIDIINGLVDLRAQEKKDPKVSYVKVIAQTAAKYLQRLYSPEGFEKLPFNRKKEFEAIDMSLREVISKIADEKILEGNGEKPQLEDLVNQLSIDPRIESEDGECLTLSTIHQAKGLEWKHVFIMGCHEAQTSFFRNGDETTRDEAEEECRLLYVAMTRAMDDLIMTCNRNPIRFLKGAPMRLELSAACQEQQKMWQQQHKGGGKPAYAQQTQARHADEEAAGVTRPEKGGFSREYSYDE